MGGGQQAAVRLHRLLVPRFLQRGAVGGGAAVLPHDRARERLARRAVPEYHRRALVGDADRRDMLGAARARDHLARAGKRRVPDFGGVMLDETGTGTMLPYIALSGAERGAVGGEQHSAGRSMATVEDDDLIRNGVNPIPSALGLRSEERSAGKRGG